jgi:hypothetical protein
LPPSNHHKRHSRAAIRHLARATRQRRPGNPGLAEQSRQNALQWRPGADNKVRPVKGDPDLELLRSRVDVGGSIDLRGFIAKYRRMERVTGPRGFVFALSVAVPRSKTPSH